MSPSLCVFAARADCLTAQVISRINPWSRWRGPLTPVQRIRINFRFCSHLLYLWSTQSLPSLKSLFFPGDWLGAIPKKWLRSIFRRKLHSKWYAFQSPIGFLREELEGSWLISDFISRLYAVPSFPSLDESQGNFHFFLLSLYCWILFLQLKSDGKKERS